VSLKNIKVDILLQLPEDDFKRYFDILEHIRECREINGYEAKVFTELEYGQVKYVQKTIDSPEGLFKAFEWSYGVELKELKNWKATDFFRGVSFIKQQIKEIAAMEETAFSGGKTDQKLLDAGIEKLEIFSELNTLIAVGEQFNKSPEEIEKWQYQLVFSIMYHKRISGEINSEYQRLMSKNK